MYITRGELHEPFFTTTRRDPCIFSNVNTKGALCVNRRRGRLGGKKGKGNEIVRGEEEAFHHLYGRNLQSGQGNGRPCGMGDHIYPILIHVMG